MDDVISKAVEIFCQDADKSPQELVDHIAAAVGDRELAERLYEFVPIAFTRAVFESAGIVFQDSFRRVRGKGKLTHFCPLSSEPLWEPALAFARRLNSSVDHRDAMAAVLQHCGLCRAITEAGKSGANLRGSVMAGPIFLRQADMPCKPWWKIW
ncbi:MAG: hypothetical protein SH850_05140 [Planctomycetaceae bacterium]|nr:hypothetical protein [Planctomycetaceae bacterium]